MIEINFEKVAQNEEQRIVFGDKCGEIWIVTKSKDKTSTDSWHLCNAEDRKRLGIYTVGEYRGEGETRHGNTETI